MNRKEPFCVRSIKGYDLETTDGSLVRIGEQGESEGGKTPSTLDGGPSPMTGLSLPVRGPAGEETTVPLSDCLEFIKKSTFCKIYDRIETDPSRVDFIDLAIPAYLDAVPNFRAIRKELETLEHPGARLDEMSHALLQIPRDLDLWEWSEPRHKKQEALTNLYRSCNMPRFKAASFSKMLHRKRPQLLPILDEYVMTAWGIRKGSRWSSDTLADITLKLGDALSDHQVQLNLSKLQTDVADLGPPWSALTRLRIYDIVTYWQTRRLRGLS